MQQPRPTRKKSPGRAALPKLCQSLTAVGNQIQFCITGELGRTFNIEAAPDLSNWTLLSTAVNTNSSLNFTDPARSNFGLRFYRVSFDP